jgi:N-acetyltransferase 10
MGYGTAALKRLEEYYKGCFDIDMSETNDTPKEKPEEQDKDMEEEEDEEAIGPKKVLPPLLAKLSERKAEKLDYMGVSYGLTSELLKFWKKNGYLPVYMRQTSNDLTGEHTCIMLKPLAEKDENQESRTNDWLGGFWADFQKRFVSLLAFQFSKFKSATSMNILQNSSQQIQVKPLEKSELELYMSLYDLKRLEMYSQNLVDYHLIVDLLPSLARLYFLGKFGSTTVSAAQAAILLSIGLQHKEIEQVEEELQLPVSQILGLFNRAIRKLTNFLKAVEEKEVEKKLALPEKQTTQMNPLSQTLDDELNQAAKKVESGQKKQMKKLTGEMKSLNQYSIKGSEDDWDKVLNSDKGRKTLVSIKTIEPKRALPTEESSPQERPGKKVKKHFKNFKKNK